MFFKEVQFYLSGDEICRYNWFVAASTSKAKFSNAYYAELTTYEYIALFALFCYFYCCCL